MELYNKILFARCEWTSNTKEDQNFNKTNLTFIFVMMYVGKYDSFFVYAITIFRAEEII